MDSQTKSEVTNMTCSHPEALTELELESVTAVFRLLKSSDLLKDIAVIHFTTCSKKQYKY